MDKNLGVKEFCIPDESSGQRLDLWLALNNDNTRSYFQKLITENCVLVNGKPERANYRLRVGDAVRIFLPVSQDLNVLPEDIPLNIVYEDNDIIVINKSRGMVVHPGAGNYTGTLVNALLYHCKDSLSDINGVVRPGIVHRIDRDTTGLLVAAKNNVAHVKLSEQLKCHMIKRSYIALADGVISENQGIIDAPIGRHPTDRLKMAVISKSSREAVTRFKVQDRFQRKTLLELSLETGRTHQIRVHLAYIGHPVTGDPVYGKKDNLILGQALHAFKLELMHPVTGENLVFTAPLPDDLVNLINFYSAHK
ncbi:MAG: RluA family pseudouridine synthase [Clostridiales bacterium]|jgi:23S rRNA pseudouridine1911/1915/1917 synthase|nr:RluA family pseudouridine synthase [Clostridiales bacterium]